VKIVHLTRRCDERRAVSPLPDSPTVAPFVHLLVNLLH
jgi:hypothetical protein